MPREGESSQGLPGVGPTAVARSSVVWDENNYRAQHQQSGGIDCGQAIAVRGLKSVQVLRPLFAHQDTRRCLRAAVSESRLRRGGPGNHGSVPRIVICRIAASRGGEGILLLSHAPSTGVPTWAGHWVGVGRLAAADGALGRSSPSHPLDCQRSTAAWAFSTRRTAAVPSREPADPAPGAATDPHCAPGGRASAVSRTAAPFRR